MIVIKFYCLIVDCDNSGYFDADFLKKEERSKPKATFAEMRVQGIFSWKVWHLFTLFIFTSIQRGIGVVSPLQATLIFFGKISFRRFVRRQHNRTTLG